MSHIVGRCCAILFLAAGLCLGVETGKSFDSDQDTIVVTATREERLLSLSPYYGDVLNADELQTKQAVRTVPEALKTKTGTFVQKTSHGQGSPYIRGFTGFRTLFLIDDIRLNNSVFRDGPNQYWNTVDAGSVSRLECMHGPFSVLYGSDAIGGTVHAITRGVRDLRPGSDWDRRVYYRYSDAENSHIGRVESVGHPTDDLTVHLGYTLKTFGDVRGGADVGTQEKTGYNETDWDAKLEYFINKNEWLTLAHQGVDINDAWRTHKTIYGIDWKGLSVGDELRRANDQNRELTYLQYHHYEANDFINQLHAGLSYHSQAEQRDRLRTRDRHDIQGFDVNTVGAFVQLKSDTPIGELIYGTESYHDDVSSFNKAYNPDGSVKSVAVQGPVGDDATYDNLGIYVQNAISMRKSLQVIIGCRYDYAAADARAVQDPDTGERIRVNDEWDSVVGNARILWSLDDSKSHNLFAGVSQGFRAPNLSDLTRLDSARTDEIETPSPDLSPERFMSYEIGLKTKGALASGKFAYFYTDIDGMIVRTPTGRTIDGLREVTKKNSGDGYVHGVELDLSAKLISNFSVLGAFTWLHGVVETYPTSDPVLVEEPMDRLMPPTARLGLRWDSDRYWAECGCVVAAKADKLSSTDKRDTSRIPPGGTPGYTVYDLRFGFDVSNDLSVSAALENVTDEDYRIHGSGVNEPGRNLVLAADWVF
ncbi:MAG: TonB-dependent receptor [Lentisphaerae bacterium]|nr:TonB-dependent receptor [Lentisphaerota bacterium]